MSDEEFKNDTASTSQDMYGESLLLKVYENETLVDEIEFRVYPAELYPQSALGMVLDPYLLVSVASLACTIVLGVLGLRNKKIKSNAS